MNTKYILKNVIEPTYELLPNRMGSEEASVMLLAIGLQESNLTHRIQITDSGFGPARGLWQFEIAGVQGVMTHPATGKHLKEAAKKLGYENITSRKLHNALKDDDTLACVFARLNLWWYPHPLATEEEEAWEQYIAIWRPGKPHRYRWGPNWIEAQEAVL